MSVYKLIAIMVTLSVAFSAASGASVRAQGEDDNDILSRELMRDGALLEKVPSKRYSSGYYTNSRAKYLDRNAVNRLMRFMVGKRGLADDLAMETSDDGTIGQVGNQAVSGTKGYVILAASLDGLLDDLVRQLDTETQFSG
ncbi:unnamed protein product [Clavelina lepadiformis]|uniref:Uncharacterized protein n=1 Tax=Clavelina lepadiformis TaxID=159417 RepID=A0ABP0GHT4_CLALP